MSYPFTQMPTYEEFKEEAARHGVSFHTSSTKLIGPRGEAEVRYATREGKPPLILPNLNDADRLTPGLLENLCRRLGIDPSRFGISPTD